MAETVVVPSGSDMGFGGMGSGNRQKSKNT